MKKIVCVIMFFCMLITTGCSGNIYSNTKKIEIKLYYSNLDNSNINWITRPIEYMNTHEKYINTLKALFNGPYSSDANRSINVKTQILSVKVRDKILTVDLSKDFINETDDLTKIISTMTITNTILQFKEIMGVRINIEGKEHISPDGKPYGLLKEYELDKSKKITTTIYLPDINSKKLVKIKKVIILSHGEIMGEKILNFMIKEKSLNILKSTTIKKYKEDKGILNIDFSNDFYKVNTLSDENKKMVIYSIVNTLTELENISNINIYVEGKKYDFLIKDENINDSDIQ